MPGPSRSRRALVMGAPLALLALGCGALFPRPRGPVLPPSAQAPSFTLPDQTGAPVSLADLTRRGPAVLVFYRGHW
jgi:hypothetical protein